MKRRGVITTARRAFRYGMARQFRDTHLVWGGEILFVAGWSLMWASSLALVPPIPCPVCVIAMLVGLALPGYRQLRRATSALGRRTGWSETSSTRATRLLQQRMTLVPPPGERFRRWAGTQKPPTEA
jgi:hypothetical protein